MDLLFLEDKYGNTYLILNIIKLYKNILLNII